MERSSSPFVEVCLWACGAGCSAILAWAAGLGALTLAGIDTHRGVSYETLLAGDFFVVAFLVLALGTEIAKLMCAMTVFDPHTRLVRTGLVLTYVALAVFSSYLVLAYTTAHTTRADAVDTVLLGQYEDALRERERLAKTIEGYELQLGAEPRPRAEVEADIRRLVNSKLYCKAAADKALCDELQRHRDDLERMDKRDDVRATVDRLRKKHDAVVVPVVPEEIRARARGEKSKNSGASNAKFAVEILRQWGLVGFEVLVLVFAALKRLGFQRVAKATTNSGAATVVGAANCGNSVASSWHSAKNSARISRTNAENWVVSQLQGGAKLQKPQMSWAIQLGCAPSTMSTAVNKLVREGVVRWDAGGNELVLVQKAIPLKVVK
jgi:hypothetical protein